MNEALSVACAIRAIGTTELLTDEMMARPLPNAWYPSDHVSVVADLAILVAEI
jgi:hypothetical protein